MPFPTEKIKICVSNRFVFPCKVKVRRLPSDVGPCQNEDWCVSEQNSPLTRHPTPSKVAYSSFYKDLNLNLFQLRLSSQFTGRFKFSRLSRNVRCGSQGTSVSDTEGTGCSHSN